MTELDNIGNKLRSLRQARKISIKKMADTSGVSSSLISQIEHGKVSPSLNTLKKILDAMGETVISLVQQNSSENTMKGLIKREDRMTVTVAPGLYYEVLSAPNKSYSMFISYLSPDAGTEDFFIHEGIESGIMLKGKIELQLGDSTLILEEGDSITHSSTIPHKWRNLGDEVAIGIWVVCPPSF
ncbi:helix-turn-helix domain-containing protein [Mesotoga sp.]|jgi:transcriptional regulator with XRE-family HTH domain|uniref:helix-turn-helix domain-containing protein n=1 Tax=Mesotoga sp. TaxID=2053577 RepID=UPI00345E6410